MRINTIFFEGPLCDEVQLAADAKRQLENYASILPNAEEMLKLSQHHSPDLAARTFYEALLISEHKSFIRKLESYSAETVELSANIKILILPGMFYKEHPETGADGALIMEIAQKFGFEVELVETKSGGSVSTNSTIIEKKLAQEKHPNIWLLSISKGSSDLRHYLQNGLLYSNIKGWINIAGILKGVPNMDFRMANPLRRILMRFLCLIFPIDYQALIELQTDHYFWSNRDWPRGIEMIHILPIPHSSHIHEMLRSKYRKTLSIGPNDGLTPLTDVLDLPGHIYPVWGCDHLMRTPDMSGYIYQLFNYLSESEHVEL